MITVHAQKISIELLQILCNGRTYDVHSIFNSGFNLLINNQMCFIGNKAEILVPYGTPLHSWDLEQVSGVIHDNRQFIWDEKGKRFVSKSLVIDCCQAEAYSSSLDKRKWMITSESMQKLLSCFDFDLITGFDLSIGQIIKGCEKRFRDFFFCVQSDDQETIRQVLKRFVGFGPGLTPSGDDFIIGVLAVHRLIPFLSDRFLTELNHMASNQYTTDISVGYYQAAFSNLYSSPILSFFEGMKVGKKEEIRMSVSQILNFGSSSGRDTLAGIISALQHQANKSNHLGGR